MRMRRPRRGLVAIWRRSARIIRQFLWGERIFLLEGGGMDGEIARWVRALTEDAEEFESGWAAKEDGTGEEGCGGGQNAEDF